MIMSRQVHDGLEEHGQGGVELDLRELPAVVPVDVYNHVGNNNNNNNNNYIYIYIYRDI